MDLQWTCRYALLLHRIYVLFSTKRVGQKKLVMMNLLSGVLSGTNWFIIYCEYFCFLLGYGYTHTHEMAQWSICSQEIHHEIVVRRSGVCWKSSFHVLLCYLISGFHNLAEVRTLQSNVLYAWHRPCSEYRRWFQPDKTAVMNRCKFPIKGRIYHLVWIDWHFVCMIISWHVHLQRLWGLRNLTKAEGRLDIGL